MQPVVEVFPEVPARDRGGEVAVGGGDDADVGLLSARAAEALELPLLEHAQELRLHRRLISPTSSRKSTPPAACSIRPGLAAAAPVKAPLLVAEQLGLQELLGQRGAVQRHERPLGARRGAMDEAGHDLLAGAGLAGQEHGRVRARDLGGEGQSLLPQLRDAHATVARALGFQLRGEGHHPLFEARRPLLGFGGAALLLGQALVGEGQGDVVRDPAGCLGVLERCTMGIAREEEERGHHLAPQPHRHPHVGANADLDRRW